MRVTLGYLLGKVEDFKVCPQCKSFNWYENEKCINCSNANLKNCKESEVLRYIKDREENDEHFCLECEIDV